MLLSEQTHETHSCGDGDGVLCKLMSLFHHSGRKVANDAHLVHISRTVDLAENINSSASRATQCELHHLHEAPLKLRMLLV